MAFIRSRLSESANILNCPQTSNSPSIHGTCRNRGDNVLIPTAALHTPECLGLSATSSGLSFCRKRVDLFCPYRFDIKEIETHEKSENMGTPIGMSC